MEIMHSRFAAYSQIWSLIVMEMKGNKCWKKKNNDIVAFYYISLFNNMSRKARSHISVFILLSIGLHFVVDLLYAGGKWYVCVYGSVEKSKEIYSKII